MSASRVPPLKALSCARQCQIILLALLIQITQFPPFYNDDIIAARQGSCSHLGLPAFRVLLQPVAIRQNHYQASSTQSLPLRSLTARPQSVSALLPSRPRSRPPPAVCSVQFQPALPKLAFDTTDNTQYDFVVSLLNCAASSLEVGGSASVGTSVLVLSVSWAAASHAQIRTAAASLTASTTPPLLTANAVSVYTLSYGFAGTVNTGKAPMAAVFLLGLAAQVGSNNKLGVALTNPNQFTASTFNVTIDTTTGGTDCVLTRFDFNYVVIVRSLVNNGTGTDYNFFPWGIRSNPSTTLQTAGASLTFTVNALAFVLLPNNLIFGLTGICNDVSISTVFSVSVATTTVSSNNYNFAASTTMNSGILSHNVLALLVMSPSCSGGTPYLNTARNNCVVSCLPAYFDSCNRCWPCHFSCASCSEMANNMCLTCSTSNHRTISGTAPSTCPCNNGYLQTNVALCATCHYSCFNCNLANNAARCTSCSPTAFRVQNPAAPAPAPFSCPCLSNYIELAQVCQPCATNCTTCSGTQANCLSCMPGFWLSVAFAYCRSFCPPGQYATASPTICAFCQSGGPGYCATCVTTSSTCLSCVTGRVLLGSTCPTSCPPGQYNSSNVCVVCPAPCLLCLSATYCSLCSRPFILNMQANTCVAVCPTNYIPEDYHAGTLYCLNCMIDCVFVTHFSLGYQQPADQPTSPLLLRLTLTQKLNNVSLFLTYLTEFNFTVSIAQDPTSPSYSITLTPICQAFLNRSFSAVTVPDTLLNRLSVRSRTNRPLDPSSFNRSLSYSATYICGPGTQHLQSLKPAYDLAAKALALLPPESKAALAITTTSFQLTSSLLMANTMLPKHLYDGLSLVSIGNLWDIPPWPNSSQGRQIFGKRRLQQANLPEERLSRLGFLNRFYQNVYVHFLVVLAILLGNALVQVLYRAGIVGQFGASLGWSLCDFAQEYVVMVAFVSLGVESQVLEVGSLAGKLSLISCVGVCSLLLGYQLYRFYDFARLRGSEMYEEQFQELLVKFGHLVKNTRVTEQGLGPHSIWLDPAAYHLLSPLKKQLMMLAFAVLSSHFVWQLGTVLVLQGLELGRLLLVRPYHSCARNLGRAAVQALTLGMLAAVLCAGLEYQQLERRGTLLYMVFGWTALALAYLFNLYFLAGLVFSLYEKFWVGEFELVQQYRSRHYYEQLSEQKGLPLADFNRLCSKGTLSKADLLSLPDVDVRFELVRVSRTEDDFLLHVERCGALRMGSEFGNGGQNMLLLQEQKLSRTVALKYLPLEMKLKERVLLALGGQSQAEVKSFCRVCQRDLTPGQLLSPSCRYQEVRRGKRESVRLEGEKMLRGFPLEDAVLALLGR